jgi:hypothetical protein
MSDTPPPHPEGPGRFEWAPGQTKWQEIQDLPAAEVLATDDTAPQSPAELTDALPRLDLSVRIRNNKRDGGDADRG